MPAGLAKREDENKAGRASVTKSPVARRLASLARPSQRALVTAVTRARSTFAQF